MGFDIVDDGRNFFMLRFFIYKTYFLCLYIHPQVEEKLGKQGFLKERPFRSRIRPGTPEAAGYVIQAVRFLGLAEDRRAGRRKNLLDGTAALAVGL